MVEDGKLELRYNARFLGANLVYHSGLLFSRTAFIMVVAEARKELFGEA